MDETPPIPWIRWLLMPAFVVLAIPALLLLAVFLALRALAFGVAEAVGNVLPWRRVETGMASPLRGPHFPLRMPDAVQEKRPTRGA